MNFLKRIMLISLICLSIWLISESPVSIVGEYPMFMAFLSLLVILLSVIFFLFSYKENKKVWDKLNGVMLSVSIVGGLAFFPGMIFTGIHFKKAKSNYLIEKGVLSKALVTRKKERRSIRSKGFEIYFRFNTNSAGTISSYDIVSEDEYRIVNGGDSILIIYSNEKPEVVDLIIDKKTFETYKSRLGPLDKYHPPKNPLLLFD